MLVLRIRKKKIFFPQNADFLMLMRVVGLFIVIDALLWVYNFTALAQLKSLFFSVLYNAGVSDA
jgi:hypothetical protein